MQYKSIKGFTGFGQLGILFVFLGLGFVLAAIVQGIIAFQMIPAGTAMKDIESAFLESMNKPGNVGYARLSQVLGTCFMLFIPAVLFSWVTNGRNKFWLGFNNYINIYQVLIGFLIIFAANVLASPLADLSKAVIVHFPSLDAFAQKLEKLYNDQVMLLSNLKSWPEYLMAIVIMAFFPALFEEIFFRGAMQGLLVRWWKAPLLAILVTSVIFSLIHSSVYLFVSRVALGFALGLMYHISKNIWVNIIAHFLNNAIAVTQLFYLGMHKQQISPDKIDPKFDWWIGVIAVIALYFLFVQLRKRSQLNRIKIDTKEKLILAAEDTLNPFSQKETS